MSEEYTLLDTVHRSGAFTTGRSSGSCPCANRIACRAFSSSLPDPTIVHISCSKTFATLLDRAPSLVHAWLAHGLQRRMLGALLIHVNFSSIFAAERTCACAAHHSLCNFDDVAAPIDYLESIM